ncbi:hypothetical protein J2751_001189 [Halorubrum alkaliphilum]|uniref:Uncharacterized protein n=1 Tax=Halorubrum alkaliphilum TaxID=261290 RepID=A0A8T4GDJ4_9EURY|nr:hypothetical protein [Halorubrum alkaliphilum]MBP1922183.1 hypothetical protein [Halorubrum alkaliphilum]
MLYAGNPYVLPSTIAGAIAYLGATILTEASLLVRLGVLVGIVGVVPIVLNRVRGVLVESTASDGAEAVEEAETDAEAMERAETGETETMERAETGETETMERSETGETETMERSETGETETMEDVDAKPDRSGS